MLAKGEGRTLNCVCLWLHRFVPYANGKAVDLVNGLIIKQGELWNYPSFVDHV